MNKVLKPTIKDLIFSPIRPEHYPAAVDLINAADREYTGHNTLSYDGLANDLNSMELEREVDTRGLFSPEGAMLGYADFWRGVAPHVRYFGFVRLHPQHRGKGIGTALTDWLEERAARQLAAAPDGLQVTLNMRAYAAQTNARAFLESRGYVHVRSSYRMTIDLDAEIPQPVFPPEYTVRTIRPDDEDLRRVLQAEQEAFLDHYGVIPEPFEAYFKHRKHDLLNDPSIDFSACYVVLAGEEVAGMVFNAVSLAGDETTGWVGTLSVRRPYRKQGLGLALLYQTFHEMHCRGRKRVGLYVDAENLTGALRLYQKAGMRVDYESCLYEKELRPGRVLANLG